MHPAACATYFFCESPFHWGGKMFFRRISPSRVRRRSIPVRQQRQVGYCNSRQIAVSLGEHGVFLAMSIRICCGIVSEVCIWVFFWKHFTGFPRTGRVLGAFSIVYLKLSVRSPVFSRRKLLGELSTTRSHQSESSRSGSACFRISRTWSGGLSTLELACCCA